MPKVNRKAQLKNLLSESKKKMLKSILRIKLPSGRNKMKIISYSAVKCILILLLCSYVYANDEIVVIDSLRHQNTIYHSTLTQKNIDKDKSGMVKISYNGEITLSGVIQMYLHQEEANLFQSLTFYPDIQTPNPLPYFDFEQYQGIQLIADMKDNDFMKAKQIFGDNININDKYILGGIAMRAMITLQDYYAVSGSDISFDNGAYAKIKPHSLKPLSNTKRWFVSKGMIYSYFSEGLLLSYASKDSYINLRQSPNGKILQAIQKDEMLNDCNMRSNELQNQGVLLSLGKDPTNPKWLKVAYIPKEASDTSKAIYGVIHESQVSFDCGE